MDFLRAIRFMVWIIRKKTEQELAPAWPQMSLTKSQKDCQGHEQLLARENGNEKLEADY